MNMSKSENNTCNSNLESWCPMSNDEQLGQKRRRLCFDELQTTLQKKKEHSIQCIAPVPSYSTTATKVVKEDQYRHHQQQQNEVGLCYIDYIPRELFFKIISFIGPASSTLITLTQINKRYAHIMQQVGHSMLVRSKACYKLHLPKIYINESLMSLCTRHVRCFQDMMDKCNMLKNFLEKDFVHGCFMDALKRGWIDIAAMNEISAYITKRDESTTATSSSNIAVVDNDINRKNEEQSNALPPTHSHPAPYKVPTTTSDIDQAMDIALDILGKDNISYFLEHRNLPIEALHPSLSTNGRKNILEYFTTKMERHILILCGKCGGKVFKYIKMISLLQQSRQNITLDSVNEWKDEERLDRARLIMQLVIYRLMVIQKSDSEPIPREDDFISSAEITQSDEDEVSLSDVEEDGSSVKTDEDKSVNGEPFYTWLEG